jgi:hypothetical protein
MLITAKGSFAGATLRVFGTISSNEVAADYRVLLVPSVIAFDARVGSRRSRPPIWPLVELPDRKIGIGSQHSRRQGNLNMEGKSHGI